MAGIIVIFVLNEKKFSSHMYQISEHINYSNHKNYSHDKMRKMIVNLGSKKCEDNKNSTYQLNNIQNQLLTSIIDAPEKDVSNIDRKIGKRNVRTSSIKSSSTLFSCSIRAMYNRVHRAQSKRLILKSYINGINTSILPKKHNENMFF